MIVNFICRKVNFQHHLNFFVLMINDLYHRITDPNISMLHRIIGMCHASLTYSSLKICQASFLNHTTTSLGNFLTFNNLHTSSSSLRMSNDSSTSNSAISVEGSKV